MKKLFENPNADLDQIDHIAVNSVGISNTKNSQAKNKSYGFLDNPGADPQFPIEEYEHQLKLDKCIEDKFDALLRNN